MGTQRGGPDPVAIRLAVRMLGFVHLQQLDVN